MYVRGCIRRAAAGAYVLDENRPFTLEVLDNRDRSIWQQQVQLGRFGTFHADFPLPAAAREGRYCVQVRDVDERTYEGKFDVREHWIEPVRLIVSVPRAVYYRGEPIEGTIRAEHFYGAPLAEREVRYQLEGGRPHTAQTDANGETRFRVDTDEYQEGQRLKLTAEMPEERVRTSIDVTVATQGFSLEISTPRRVFVAGEPFEALVGTRGPDNRPVSQKLKLKVFQRTEVAGRCDERLAGEHPLETDALHGQARVKLQLDQGGNYVLRAEGTDQFGHAVSMSWPIQISGDDDQVRLRILSDRSTFKAGQTADVTLHWREDPALALVTLEGARVLDYQLLKLNRGANRLQVPLTARLAPNFQLSVAVMVDPKNPAAAGELPEKAPRLFTASSSFAVAKDLNVQLAVQRKDATNGPVRPGDQVAVTITTTDSAGKPVAAEVGLGLFDQALLRPGPTGGVIGEVFAPSQRRFSLVTESSITLNCRPEPDRASATDSAFETKLDDSREEPAQPADKNASAQPPAQTAPEDITNDRIERSSDPRSPENQDPFGGGASADPFGGTAADDPFGQPADPPNYRAKPRQFVVPAKNSGDTPSSPFAAPPDETGYWNPAVVTDNDGQATVTFTVPDRSTVWQLQATAITADTLVGETTAELVVGKELAGDLTLPPAFTDGDQAEILATVYNRLVEKGPLDVTLKTIIAGHEVEVKRRIEVQAKGTERLRLPISVARPAEPPEGKQQELTPASSVSFELTVAAGGQTDVVRRTVPLQPYGLPLRAWASGAATAGATVSLEPPGEKAWESPSLQILISPTVEQSLVDLVLGGAAAGQSAGCRRTAAASRSDAGPGRSAVCCHERLDGGPESRGAAGRPGRTGPGDRRPNPHGGQRVGRDAKRRRRLQPLGPGRCEHAAEHGPRGVGPELLRQAGREAPPATYEAAIELLEKRMTATADTDYEVKAVLLHALAAAGHGDFAVANRLHRTRESLSTAALAYLALAFAEMDRKATAAELVELLKQRPLDDGGSKTGEPLAPLPGSQSPVELRALVALAMLSVAPQGDEAKEADRVAHGPSHGPPVLPGQGHRPGRRGAVPLVRATPLRRGDVPADRAGQRPAGRHD